MAGAAARHVGQEPLGRSGHQAPGGADPHRSRGQASAAPPRRRRIALRRGGLPLRRFRHGDGREHGLSAQRLRAHHLDGQWGHGAGDHHGRRRAPVAARERAGVADLHAVRSALDRRAPRRTPEAGLGRQGQRAPRDPDAHGARRHAPPTSSRRRRADLHHRGRQRGRIWSGDYRQHELPAERLRAHRDDQERRDAPGRGLGSNRAGVRRKPEQTNNTPNREASMRQVRGLFVSLLVLMLVTLCPSPGAAAPEGEMVWGVHISLAPTWFDPAETSGIITPFMVIAALHDAVLKAMPGNPRAPSLAESWSMSPDGLTYDFVLRKGAKFHNGDPVTAEDVKFSLERYRGASAKALRASVAEVETPDPSRVRIRLTRPWPDFMTFYLGATGAAWIVPKKYVEKVGDEGFKKAPIGAGPYKFVSFTPVIERVVEE